MQLFSFEGKDVKTIEEVPFKYERDIQALVERNLEEIFGFKFIDTEFPLKNLRIDTLAFNEETKSFVIIEYKRDKSISVIDQGFAYLALMLNNKAEFILHYNERLNKSLRKNDVDWEGAKVIFVANKFTPHQQKAIEFKDLPIELWEVCLFKKGLISFNQIKPVEARESIKAVTKNNTIQSVTKVVRTFSIEDHFRPGWERSRDIYEKLSQSICSIDDRIEIKAVKPYIAFKIGFKNVVLIHVQKSRLILVLTRTQPKDIKDPENKVIYQKNSMKYYSQHLSEYSINSIEDVDYAIYLAKQVYRRNFS